MSTQTQIETCSEHYSMWKDRALFSNDLFQSRKAMDRAFFWLEMRSAFIFLHTIEQTKGNDNKDKEKLIQAKMNLSRKLSDY